MKIKKYDKLVRDKIPEIIKKDGKSYKIKKLNSSEHLNYLNNKLKEEVDEYLEDNNIEELADIIEVIYGIIDLKEINKDKLEEIRKNKLKKRGGFKKGIKLTKVFE